MKEAPQLMLDWSEVWATLIPVYAWLRKRQQPPVLKPVIIYLWLALFLNLAGDIIGDYKRSLPDWLQSNNVLYNVHSLVRFTCFGYFFYSLHRSFRHWLNRVVNTLALVFIIYNFTYIESFVNPRHLSGNLLATEAYLLLIYCMQYYLSQLKREDDTMIRGKEFWVVTGLCIYVVVNFFVFLFYVPLLSQNWELADKMWNVHNLAYICLCIFIAKAFYVPLRD
jgi:hypothetical protein